LSVDLLTITTAPAAWIDARDPRVRLLTALFFALLTVNLNGLPALLVLLGVALALALASGIAPSLLLQRLLALEGFMLVLMLFLPFTVPGELWFRLGSLSASQEGALQALTIFLRAHAVVILLLVLVGTLDPVKLGHALAQLRLPDKLVHLLLFTVRYLGVLHAEYSRLRQAMRTRGFKARSDRYTWRVLGWLMGMLLVRSLERSRRIHDAMKCRGFNGRFYLIDGHPWRWGDSLFGLGALVCLLALLGLDRCNG
jgi:cobalt/nickel transport system permease protein